MTVAALFGPSSLLAVFPSKFSFYERIGMDDEHYRTHTQTAQTHRREHVLWYVDTDDEKHGSLMAMTFDGLFSLIQSENQFVSP